MPSCLYSSFKLICNVPAYDPRATHDSPQAECSTQKPKNASELRITWSDRSCPLDKQHIGSLLQNCSSLSLGKSLHSSIIQTGLDSDIFLTNHLVTMYGKYGALQEATSVFDDIALPNTVSWNVLISVYAHHGRREDSFRLFKQLQEEGFQPNKITFLSLLRVCDNPAALLDGEDVHSCIIFSGLDADPILGGALVTMYGRCEALQEAWLVFVRSNSENIASWNGIITVLSQKGNKQKALNFFVLALQRDIDPDRTTFTSVLHLCDDEADLEHGMLIHTCIIESGLDIDCIVGTALINMYGKCGALNEACRVFNDIPDHDVVSWTALISAHVQQEHDGDALGCFARMLAEGIKPNGITVVSVLNACSSLRAMDKGEALYSYVIESGFESNCHVGNAVINMYVSCGALDVARRVFDGLCDRDVATWTIMIDAYNESKRVREALNLFWQFRQGQYKPDEFLFIGALNACAILLSLRDGERVHNSIIDCGYESNFFVQTALVKMYGDCEAIDKAQSVFDELRPRDLIAWNAMLSVYAKQGCYDDCLRLFEQMVSEGTVPDATSFLSVVSACAGLSIFSQGVVLHAHIVECGLELDVLVGNALINMYGKCGTLDDACFLFEKMRCHTVMTWTSMMAAYSQQGQVKMVIEAFQSMLKHGVQPDEIAFVTVLSACSHGGLIEEGLRLFISMKETHGITPTVAHYRCIIDLFGRPGLLKEAESFISKMSLEPDSLSWLSLLSACKEHGNSACGRLAAEQAIDMNVEYSAPYVLLSNIYSVDEISEDSENSENLVVSV